MTKLVERNTKLEQAGKDERLGRKSLLQNHSLAFRGQTQKNDVYLLISFWHSNHLTEMGAQQTHDSKLSSISTVIKIIQR